MINSKHRMIRGLNLICALGVTLGCSAVITQNAGKWHIILSALATMFLWSTLGYATWHGLAPDGRRDVIRRALIVNLSITVLFSLMILTTLFSSEKTPFPILIPMGMLTFPFLLNVWALAKRKARLDGNLPEKDLGEERKNTTRDMDGHFQVQERHNPTHFLSQHWRGELPLSIAFWLNGGVITGIGTAMLGGFVSILNHSDQSLRMLSFLNLSALVLLGISWIWACVGIWRSAEKQAIQDGSAKWKNAAQASIILGILLMIGPFSQNFVPQLKECALIASGHDPLGTVHIIASANKKSVIVNGMLREGSAAKIRKILDATPAATSLMLNSSGGRVLEAKELAALVRTRKLDTYVEGQCSSACTYIFLAGKDRAATPNAQIGFHQPSFPGIDLPTQMSITQDMLEVYRSAGLPETFIKTIAQVPPQEMWHPNRDELIEAHVITRVSLGGETATIGTAVRSRQELLLILQSLPLFQAAEKRFPGTAQEAVKRGWAVNEKGGTDAQMMNAVRSVFSDVYPKLLRTASPDTLDEFVNLLLKEMSAAQLVSDLACAQLMVAKLDILKTLPQDIVEQEERFFLKALAEPPRVEPATPDPARVTAAIQRAMISLSPQYLPVVMNITTETNQPALRCEATIAFYRAIAHLPTPERHIALQGLFQGNG